MGAYLQLRTLRRLEAHGRIRLPFKHSAEKR
jgi:hypothetical protein